MTSSLIAQNCNAIDVALRDYVAHVHSDNANAGIYTPDISDAFIHRLATDATNAKSGLRDMFRQVDGWNEDLQAVILNGTQTHNPDNAKVYRLVSKLLDTAPIDYSDRLIVAKHFFLRGVEKKPDFVDALKYFIGKKYRADKKKSKLFNELAKAVGIDTTSKEYKKLYAQLADELNGRQIDFKLFLSINPAHILTASNPIDDVRGECLVSCHSLNRDDFSYGTGNIGYARDNVTFVAFTVADPTKPELLNNRKNNRQLYHYKPNSGVLLQNRLYTSRGGVYGKNQTADLYRDLVQRTISQAECADNLWITRNYNDGCNDFDIGFDADKNFSGYSDWTRYDNATIRGCW